MRRPAGPFLIVSAILVAGIVGLVVGRFERHASRMARRGSAAAAKPSPLSRNRPDRSSTIVNPDGLPDYSLTSEEDFGGQGLSRGPQQRRREFRGESSGNYDRKGGERGRIRYYRNPMGLPDTSPTPKKDSMGMDYLARL